MPKLPDFSEDLVLRNSFPSSSSKLPTLQSRGCALGLERWRFFLFQPSVHVLGCFPPSSSSILLFMLWGASRQNILNGRHAEMTIAEQNLERPSSLNILAVKLRAQRPLLRLIANLDTAVDVMFEHLHSTTCEGSSGQVNIEFAFSRMHCSHDSERKASSLHQP